MSYLFWNGEERRLRAFWRLLAQLVLLVTLFVPASVVATGAGSALLIIDGELTPEEVGRLLADPLALLGHPILSVLLSLAALFAFAGSVWLAGALLDRRRFTDFGLRFNRNWWSDFTFGLALGGLLMLLIFLVEWTAGWITVTETFDSGPAAYPFAPAISAALFSYISVGIYEELFSRGYQLKNIAEGLRGVGSLTVRGAVIASLFLSSLVFGVAHAFNPNATLMSSTNLILAGVFLGTGYVLTRELAIPIGLHISWNFFQGNVFGFPVSGAAGHNPSFVAIEQGGPPLVTGGAFGPEGGLIGVAAMLLGIFLTWAWVRRRYGRATIQEQIARRELDQPSGLQVES
jgi:uncharacterized protein